MKFLKSLKLSFKIGVLIAIAIILASASVAFFSTKIDNPVPGAFIQSLQAKSGRCTTAARRG